MDLFLHMPIDDSFVRNSKCLPPDIALQPVVQESDFSGM